MCFWCSLPFHTRFTVKVEGLFSTGDNGEAVGGLDTSSGGWSHLLQEAPSSADLEGERSAQCLIKAGPLQRP